MERQYDNELTPELLARLNHSSFTAEELAELDDEVRALVAEQEASRRQHPIIAIYRPAVAGCLTRNGGTGDEFNPDSEKGRKIRLKNGVWASVLTESCTVSYPDGSHARIVSSAGNRNRLNGQGVAVVGSIPISLRWHFIRLYHLPTLHQIMMLSSTPRLPRRRSLLKIFQSQRNEAPCINGGSVIMRKSNTRGQ